jgi:hypothetical protein
MSLPNHRKLGEAGVSVGKELSKRGMLNLDEILCSGRDLPRSLYPTKQWLQYPTFAYDSKVKRYYC